MILTLNHASLRWTEPSGLTRVFIWPYCRDSHSTQLLPACFQLGLNPSNARDLLHQLPDIVRIAERAHVRHDRDITVLGFDFELDVVLSDAPVPLGVSVRAFNHLLGECGVTFVAAAPLAKVYRSGFPQSLDGSPVLLPVEGTALRRSLEQWFHGIGVRPTPVGEFDDSALLKVFGQAGAGVFAVPSIMADHVRQQYKVRILGRTDEVVERWYAISVERRVQHPAVAAICDTARTRLFQ